MSDTTKSSVNNKSNWLLAILFLLVGLVAAYYVYKTHETDDLANRKLELENAHNRANNQFSNAMEKFAGIISGMKAYVNRSQEFPSANELQGFIKNQLDDLSYEDSIVVSYIDIHHEFIYSFTANAMNPSNLVGKSVATLRNQAEINRLNELLASDEIELFQPINLFEGWNGIPMNFRVHRNNETLGYVAPILNFKAIMQSIYDDETKNDFIFSFSTNGIDFDREMIHDGSKVYHTKKDKEFYENFGVDSQTFIYTTTNYYGLPIKIGTAYKASFSADFRYLKLIAIWYLTYTLFVIFVTQQVTKYKDLNAKIEVANDQLERQQIQVTNQNEELSKLNNTKNRFFSILGHDLRGPLNSIQSLLSLLQYEEIKDTGLKNVITQLGDSTKNTVNLLNGILKWSRSQTGDIAFEPEPLKLADLIENGLKTIAAQAIDKNINIQNNIDTDIAFTADKNMIKTVLRNLLSNAIKFTPSGGQITIEAKQTESKLRIFIKDNGVGMSQAAMDKLFALDKHVSTKGTEGEVGTGLGILLCKEFIERHNGELRVESSVGNGSTFVVELPI